MQESWIERWREGRIGWHEADGSRLLKRYWPRLVRGSTVLVPFCGKSADLMWLAAQGLQIVGVELSEIAVRAFFEENDLEYKTTARGGLPCYRATTVPIRICCGDYFSFAGGPYQALYDRGALVAVEPSERPVYITHTKALIDPDAFRLIITLEYDQERVAGPPYSISVAEMQSCWPELNNVFTRNDIDTGSPKFRAAGLTEVLERVWVSG